MLLPRERYRASAPESRLSMLNGANWDGPIGPCKTGLYANIGAGEGIRTLDPNLGKVVLYP